MRRPASIALLLLLAACTVTTTGAPCGSDLECPSDQGCGSDGRCSAAALACPGHGSGGECTPGTTCSGGQLLTCTAGSGVCASGPVASDCPVHQECQSTGTSASCACSATRCGPGTASFCGPGGQVVSCAQEAGGGCWYEASSTGCADPGAACAESGGSATCACPSAGACTVQDATRCSASSTGVEACRPVATGSACLAWQPATDCASGGLVCSAGACACPPNAGATFVADAVGGSPVAAAPGPTGLDSPVACRFRSLSDALAAAAARGPGSTVRATGWSSGVPGGIVVFSEAGPIAVEPGVTLTTDDATPNAGHYAVTTGAALGGAFVTLGPGSTIAGFEIRNTASTGPGVETRCPDAADTGPVTLSGVAISSSSGGTPAVRFSSGLHAAGSCPVSMTGGSVSGALTGILAEAEAPTRLSGGSVTGNVTGVSIGAAGAIAPTLSAAGTSFASNTGDAVYVARGRFESDACPYADNGTHVHAQPVGGAVLEIVVQNSRGLARMSGAADSAFRLLAAGVASSSSVTIAGNEIVGNDAPQLYTLGTTTRRGGGLVFTFPMPTQVTVEGNFIHSNKGDQVLVAASAGSLDLRGGSACETPSNNTFGCYDAGAVGIFSNGATVLIDTNHWTQQPAGLTVDYAGAGIVGASNVCSPATISCP